MRLLRPPPCRCSISAGEPISARTASKTPVKRVLSVCTENLFFDVLPSWADGIRPRCVYIFGKQYPLKPGRKCWVRENFLKIIYEVCTTQLLDATELGLSRSFKIYVSTGDSVTAIAKKSAHCHPVACCFAKVYAVGIIMPEFRFVADYHDRHVINAAAVEKRIDAFKHFRLGETFSVDLSLQSLP